MKTISIVVPAYNEAENLPRLHEVLTEEFKNLPYELELVIVNDGSSDHTQRVVEELSTKDPRVKYVEFDGNFGQQAATSAGLAYATGDAVMIMDADLQHPAVLIPEFVKRWEEGSELVFGIRKARQSESGFRILTSRIAGFLINRKERSDLPYNVADFSILDRKVVDAFKKLPPEKVMTRYRIRRAASTVAYIPFDIDERFAGHSAYTVGKLLKLLIESLLSRPGKSSRPLYSVRTTNFHA